MTQANTSFFGKKHTQSVSDQGVDQRSQLIAKDALRDLVYFHEVLESQMRDMLVNTKHGTALDNELFDKMLVAKERYLHVMKGFTEAEVIEQRNALIAFADAVQDIMISYNMRRKH